MNEFEKRLGGIVKYHRKKSGLTQERLAVLAGVGKTVVFDIEKGKTSIQLDTLQKVLNVLNIQLHLESPLMNECTKQQEVDHEES